MLCTLEEVLKYKNNSVIERFQKYYPEKLHNAEQLFQDLLCFFWASKKHSLDKKENPHKEAFDFAFVMDEDMQEMDQMWHVFLLYSRDYMEFCQTYFKEYLHHQPDLAPGLERNNFDFEKNLEKFLNYNFDILGEDVLNRWFALSVQSSFALK